MKRSNDLRKKALNAHRDGNLDEALALYLEALEEISGDTSDIHGNIGAIYFELGEITNAHHFLERGLKLAQQQQNAVTASAINRYLGRIHRYQGQLHKAVAHFKESAKLLKELEQQDKLTSTLLALGETYLKMRQRVEAEQCLYQVLNLSLKNKNKSHGLKAQKLLNQLKEHNTLDTLAIAEISALSLEKASLANFQEINVAINSHKPVDVLLDLIVDKAIELTQAGRGFLILENDKKLAVRTARASGKISLESDINLVPFALVERCRVKKEPVLLESVRDHKSLSFQKKLSDSGINSVLCVPIRHSGSIRGIFYLDSPVGGTKFSPTDMESLTQFSVQASIAMDISRLLEENRKQQEILKKNNQELNTKVVDQGEKINSLKDQLRSLGNTSLPVEMTGIIGQSPRILKTIQLIDKVADTDIPVIVQGESGTGKELVARALHKNSHRQDKNFVGENCGAIPENLLESVLFGHLAGSFTGAIKDKEGLFQLADNGTLFLDEISEMPLELQKSLLRALEEGEIRPIGSTENIKINVRILCATNRNLKEEVAAGNFREDLYYRLNGILIEVPPLRDREGDVIHLIKHFLKEVNKISVDSESLKLLNEAAWPGNVRQLQNEVKRWSALGYTKITSDLLSPEVLAERSQPIISGLHWQNRPLKEVVQEAVDLIEKEIFIALLQKHNKRKSSIARELKISRPTLDLKLKRLGLS